MLLEMNGRQMSSLRIVLQEFSENNKLLIIFTGERNSFYKSVLISEEDNSERIVKSALIDDYGNIRWTVGP